MREPSPLTVYLCWWPAHRIVKAGYSGQSRWRAFQPRGAQVLGLWRFATITEALTFEDACHGHLENFCPPAFESIEHAKRSRLLGSGGGGYSECYVLPSTEDITSVYEWCCTNSVGVPV